MLKFKKVIFVFTVYILLANIVSAKSIETIFGKLEISSPLVVKIIDSEGFQRLKGVDQSGPLKYFVEDYPAYTRFDHSLGVFHLLNKFGASFEEQVAGLLHDTSHTAFSHLADHVFKFHRHDSSYQDSIHLSALEKFGIKSITTSYNFAFEKLDHKNNSYHLLDQDLPDLCADRIEYLLHTGYIFGMITLEDIQTIVANLNYQDQQWYFNDLQSARKIALLSLHFTEGLYAAPWNWSIYNWFSKILERSFELKIISEEDFHMSVDEDIIKKIKASKDLQIQQYLENCINNYKTFAVVFKKNYDIKIKPKFRGVDPLYLKNGNLVRLRESDPIYKARFNALKNKLLHGIKLVRVDSLSATLLSQAS